MNTMGLILLVAFGVVGCTHVRYREEVYLALPAKEEPVEVKKTLPVETCVRLGMLDVTGSELCSPARIERAARRKAAGIGADFIMQEDEGYEKSIKSDYTTVGSVVLPLIRTAKEPWGTYSVWSLAEADLGIKFADGLIKGFRLGSAAERSALQVGDQLVGIDGLDIDAENFQRHLLEIPAGAIVQVHVWRDGERLDVPVKCG